MVILKKNLPFLLYSLLIAFLFIYVNGYQFNFSDQEEHLPQVYKLLNPTLYPSDPFVNASSGVFTVRFYYIYLVFGLSKVFSVSSVCFSLTILCITLSSYGFMKLSTLVSNKNIVPYLAPLLIFFIFKNFTVGGNHIQYSTLISSTLAKALAPLALYHFFKQNYKLSGILLGLATLFQLLVGLQLFLIIAAILFIEKNIRKLFEFCYSYLIPASFILVPIIYRQFLLSKASTIPEDPFYFKILYSFRNNLHYLPSLFPVKDYLKLLLLVVTSTTLLPISFLNYKKRVLAFIAIAIGGCIVYTLMLENLEIYAIGKLQWFKTTIWIEAFCSIILGVFVLDKAEEIFKKKTYVYLVPVVVLLFILSKTIISKSNERDERDDIRLVHEWIQKSTPVNAVILSFPKDDGLLCEAKRSTPIAFTPIIHEAFFLVPWYYRFKEIYGVGVDDLPKGTALDLADNLYNKRYFHDNKYAINYRIDRLSKCTFRDSLGAVVFHSGDLIVTKVD